MAAQNGHLEVLHLLLEKGANKEAANKVDLWLMACLVIGFV